MSDRLGPAEAVGVVVPAHDEETLLPACLAALRDAANALRLPVHVVVVADACTDQTAAVARAAGAGVIGIRARRVGAARAAGMRELLRLTSGADPAAVWLATTDADTLVPPDWLRRQLDYANAGWDVVLGTVTVTDWDGHPPHVPVAFAERYAFGSGPHPHVHGANLGIRASAYLAAGGFPPLRTAEDHALLAAATRAGCMVAQASDIAVETSGRRLARRAADPAPCCGRWLTSGVPAVTPRPLPYAPDLDRLAGSRAGEVCAGRLRVGGQPGQHPGRGPECTAQIMSATESPRRSASARDHPPGRGPGRGGRAAMAAKADRVALEALRRSLVPAALPLVTGAEMAARYVPGRGVTGGDWYDVFTLPSGELSVVIGDVACPAQARRRYVSQDPCRALRDRTAT